jgi:hypothetical protein
MRPGSRRVAGALVAAAVVSAGAAAAAWRLRGPHDAPPVRGTVATLPSVTAAPRPSTTMTTRPVATTTTAPPPPADPNDPAVMITGPGDDVANPFVLVADHYYLLSSNQPGWTPFGYSPMVNVPTRWSDDLVHWHLGVDAMPTLPPWAQPGATWAPDVLDVSPTRHVLYFTARVRGTQPPVECIGVATSRTAWGGYVAAAAPLVCQLDHRGSIDPRSFVDTDGSRWLVWKADDNADVHGTEHTSIWSQRLAPDGTRLVGAAVQLIGADQRWEGRIVEAPQLVRDPAGRYWLFYSGNWFNQRRYGIGVASCSSPAGPCTKPFDRAWLGSNAQGSGPGEGSLFHNRDDKWYLVYSPHSVAFRTPTPRPVAMAHVAFGPGGPYLARVG